MGLKVYCVINILIATVLDIDKESVDNEIFELTNKSSNVTVTTHKN